MIDDEHGGAAGADTSDIGAVAAPVRERRMTAGRKRDAVLRVLKGEPLEIVAHELATTAADLSGWRDAFLEAGAAGLRSRSRDDRDRKIDRLQSKLGEVLMDNELLTAKIDRLEAGAPFAARAAQVGLCRPLLDRRAVGDGGLAPAGASPPAALGLALREQPRQARTPAGRIVGVAIDGTQQ